MKEILLQLMTILNVGGYPVVAEFNPPSANAGTEVRQFLTERYGWCPVELEALYNWHNGQAFPVPVNDFHFLFDHALFLPFEQAKLYSEVAASNDSAYNEYFVVFTSGGGEDYLMKMQGEEKGAIFYSSPSEFLGEPVKAFDSFEKLFLSVIVCYEAGVYWSQNGQFRIDIRKQMKKMAELNPGCPRWVYDDPI